jgi:putative membrane protein
MSEMMDSGVGMGWMWLFWLLLLLGVVLLVVVAVRAVGGGVTRPPTGRPDPAARPGRGRAREILDERYARGEITTEEYRERLAGLGDDT